MAPKPTPANGSVRRLPEPRAPAVAEMLAPEFLDRPFRGDSYGEMLPLPTAIEPKPPAAQPFTIPEWSQEEREREAALAAAEPEPPPMTPVESLMSRAAALGELGFPEHEFGTPLQLQPLERFQGAPVDWDAETRRALREERRARREAARHLLAEEEDPGRHPPPRRGAT